jgi:glycosyltransferase involved in cell wall biosynthesis
MRLAVVTCFLNEQPYLDIFLESIASQERPPDRFLLVDDGSTDRSGEIAADFAARHDYARLLTRPRRPAERDRLARAAELAAFSWGVERLDLPWDIVAKLDADLKLTPDCFAEMERLLEGDPKLGVVGPYLSVESESGERARERCPPDHVRGPTKFYRRECFAEVFPVPVRLGWDTSDEVVARMRGWRTASHALPAGDPIHLRPTSAHDGFLRGQRRAGTAAWAYGAGPGWAALSALRRSARGGRPLAGPNYLLGWTMAGLRRDPRADPAQRAFVRHEHRRRVRAGIRRWLGR